LLCGSAVKAAPQRIGDPTSRPPDGRRLPALTLTSAMLACLTVVGVLAFLDADRESSSGLRDFADEQARLARAVALHLSSRLEQARRDLLIIEEASASGTAIPPGLTGPYDDVTPATPGRRRPPLAFVTEGLAALELPMQVVVLVRAPGLGLRTTGGRPVSAPPIEAALDALEPSARLDRLQAATVGLAPRTAVVGLGRIDGGTLGHWDVAVAASAERLRDREWWARWRLVLTVAAAGALVFLFGGIALLNQRRELVAGHALAVARIHETQEDRFQRAARAATLGTLAIGVAHELSTPLAVISGRAEQLLERLRGDERNERAARTVLEQTEGIGRVIKGLLHLARGGTPEFIPVDADAVVAAAGDMVAHKFVTAQVVLQTVPSGDAPMVMGDSPLLEHAVINLLLNACDASPRGGRVLVEVDRRDDSVAISVTDEGPGISDEEARLAVQPFFTTKSPGEGTGLGLAIAHEIVSSHRGTLTLEREDPSGTLARIILPTAEPS
jgi:two-component system NtrC family sensor kinase